MVNTRFIAALMIAAWCLSASLQSYALTYIDYGLTLYTTGTTTQYTDSFWLASGANVRLIDSGGNNGGYVTLNIPNGGYFRMDNGATFDLSANTLNSNGGTFILNSLGTSTITLNGRILANGLGTGSGGLVNLVGNDIVMSSTGVIEAMGGSTGLGGVITLEETGGTFQISSGADLTTTGRSDATHNLITLEGQGIEIDNQIVADGVSNSAGGTITLIANNGQVKVKKNADLLARGNGSGAGGTIDMQAHQAGTSLSLTDCSGNPCNGGGLVVLQASRGTNLDVNAGNGTDNGIIRISRAGSGTIDQDFSSDTGHDAIVGAGTVIWGDDSGNTTSVTLQNFDKDSDFNGSDTDQHLFATGAITATNNNDFDTVLGYSNNGAINISDNSGGMSASVQNTSGTSTLTSTNGTLTVTDSNATGAVNLSGNGTITATSNNALTGAIQIYGSGGTGTSAGAISITNTNASLNIDRIRGSSANVTVTGSNRDIDIDNANISGASTLTATRDIDASATSNNFGSSVAASGRNLNFYDNAGTLTLNNVTATGSLTTNTASGVNLSLNNTDVTGAASIRTGGSGGDISGNTANVFRGSANLNTQDTAGGDLAMTADFQGTTYLYGAQVAVTDTAGDLYVASYTQGAGNSTVSTTGAGGDLTMIVAGLNGGGAGKVTLSSADRVTLNGNNQVGTNDTIVANSTAGGNLSLSNMATLSVTGRSTAQTGPSAGTWLGTNGGSVALTSVDVTNNVDITGADIITLGTAANSMTIGGTTNFSASSYVVGASTFGGTVTGTSGKIGLEVTSGDFTSGGITATSGAGWYGGADETMIIQTRTGDILGSGYTTSGAGNMRLQAGAWNYLGAGNAINVNNVSAAQNAAFYATGTNGNTSIKIRGTSNVNGHITATGINASNQRTGLSKGVDIVLTSGNLTTASIVSDSGTVDLTASNGSILQNASVYSGMANKTIRANGDVTLSANGGSGSYIDTGLVVEGTGSDLTAKASGKSGGNNSIGLIGFVEGNVTLTNQSNGNVTGNINLGSSLGDTSQLNDVYTVFDVANNLTAKASGDINFYGGYGRDGGYITLNAGGNITGRIDRWETINLNGIHAGGDIDIRAYNQSRILGGDLSGQDIFLQSGSQWTRDKMTYVNLDNVTATGNLTMVVVGSTTGGSDGNSVVLTNASISGSTNVTNEAGGAARGNVTITP